MIRCILVFSLVLMAVTAHGAQTATGSRGMVASGHPLATSAGVEVLKSGGNAIDAAVAVGLTLGVVDQHNSGIGGGCFILLRRANGEIVAIDGRERAPARAFRDMFIRNGKADPDLSQTGALAVGVPGELAAFEHVLQRYGTMRLADLLEPAARIAEEGFEVSPAWSNRTHSVRKELAQFPAAAAVFLRDGLPPRAGTILRQPDLASTYRSVATDGTSWFYAGPFARAVDRWMKENGGLMTAADFASYRVIRREPVRGSYRGLEIVSFPPPSSGGVHLIQMLNILRHFQLRGMDEVTRMHVMAEAMKLAFADRAHWLGDPDFVTVPAGLVSERYAAELAGKIDLSKTIRVSGHGMPPGASGTGAKHTTHFSVADAEGNWVACTATVNTTFGSKVVIPGTGVVLNNQMDDFTAQPGAKNYFGLTGAEANSIMPRKTPLSSMTPTLVLRNGKPMLAVGAAGGPRIITAVLVQVVGIADLGWTPQQAMSAPRLHQQWMPDALDVEQSLPETVQQGLNARGHVLRVHEALSTSHSVAFDLTTGVFTGNADPRYIGSAAGF